MNWNNIQTLEEEGHEIGSHSMNHKKLSKLSDEEMTLLSPKDDWKIRDLM
jgi:peptidoglycan/xylan/chitin deacetylase (PgdA/CDA1 family)